MGTELDTLSEGELQPYNPGVQELQPSWGTLAPRTDLDEYQRPSSQAPTVFGTALPAGTTQAQIDAILGQISGVFLADFSALGYPNQMIQSAIQFMTTGPATKAPYHVTPQHNFNLHGHEDWLGHAFGNMVQGLSGSPRAKQQFVTACLKWLTKVNKHLAGQQTGAAPRTTTQSSENSLTDAEWAELNKRNEALKITTENTLRQKWGVAYTSNMEVAQQYLDGLSMPERQHFNQLTPQGVALNTVEVLEHLYHAAIGKHSIPTSGGAVAAEIREIETLITVNRKAYNKDIQIQARLRELYSIRDRG